MSFAVIQTGGKQYKVSASEILKIERLNNEEGKTVEFKNVLFLNDDKTTEIGDPNIQGAKVEATTAEGDVPTEDTVEGVEAVDKTEEGKDKTTKLSDDKAKTATGDKGKVTNPSDDKAKTTSSDKGKAANKETKKK